MNEIKELYHMSDFNWCIDDILGNSISIFDNKGFFVLNDSKISQWILQSVQ